MNRKKNNCGRIGPNDYFLSKANVIEKSIAHTQIENFLITEIHQGINKSFWILKINRIDTPTINQLYFF